MNRYSRKWLKKWFDRKVGLMVVWGFDYDHLKDLWKLVDDRKTYHETKKILDDAMHSQTPYNVEWIPVDQLKPMFEREVGDLAELKRTVKKQNILQPLLVRETQTANWKEKKYEIVCGYRRWEAAKQARLTRVPCIVRNVSDREARAFHAIENMHRKDWNPIEEGRFYKECLDKDFFTQKDLASFIGIGSRRVSQGYISNRVRLLKLTDKNQSYIARGKLKVEHGLKLLKISEPNLQTKLGEEAVTKRLSSRQLGNIVKKIVEGEKINVDKLIEEILLRSPCELIEKMSEKMKQEDSRCAHCILHRRCKNLAYTLT